MASVVGIPRGVRIEEGDPPYLALSHQTLPFADSIFGAAKIVLVARILENFRMY